MMKRLEGVGIESTKADLDYCYVKLCHTSSKKKQSQQLKHNLKMSIPRNVWRVGLLLSALCGVGASIYVWDEGLRQDAYVRIHSFFIFAILLVASVRHPYSRLFCDIIASILLRVFFILQFVARYARSGRQAASSRGLGRCCSAGRR
jgi:K+-sensing histidine kinase KdpD